MITVKRLAIYLVTFLLTVIIVIWIADWKKVDRYLVDKANLQSSQGDFLYKDLVLIQLTKQIGGSNGANLTPFRQHIVKLLNSIAQETENKNGPKGVLLDIWFKSDTAELVNIKAALKRLKDLKVPVYGVYNINENHVDLPVDEIDIDEIEFSHASEVYNDFLAGSDSEQSWHGRYHTNFFPRENLANYATDLRFNSILSGRPVLIESLVQKVAGDLNPSKSNSENIKRAGSVVPYGSLTMMEKKTYTFLPDSIKPAGVFLPPEGTTDSIDMSKNILVVGDALHDLVDNGYGKKIPGPYIVTWALSDLLDNGARLNLPMENLAAIIGQLLFFSLFAVFIFALLFKYVKRLQTKTVLIAVLAFVISMLFFFLYGSLILSFKVVIPVGHTIVATAIAVFLSWRFTHKFLVTGLAEGGQKYDVFISYSRSQSAWVDKNLYEPLAAYRKPNGDKLNIFYDKKSIGIGEAFTAKYMWAIVDSTCFIPVISEDYYGKNHCRNELDCAVKRQVEKLLTIQMVALSFKFVPEAYKCINFIDVSANADFFETIKLQLAAQ